MDYMFLLFLAGAATGCLLTHLAGAIPRAVKSKKIEVVRWRKVPHPDYPRQDEWEFEISDGRVFRGDCTVWHEHPSGRRAGTFMETSLSQEERRIAWIEQEKKKNASSHLPD